MQPKEIRITGVFKDNITPHIRKINKQIRALNQNALALSGGRGKRRTFAFFGEAAMEMGKMKAALDGSTRSLKEYRKQALLVARANQKLARANSRAAGNSGGTPNRGGGEPPSGGGESPFVSGFKGMALNLGKTAGMAVASAIGNLVSSTIVGAFRKGADIIRNVINRMISGVQERVDDQLSDIQSAGGIFSMARRKGIKEFGGNFQEALRFQKELNSELAVAAGALPGSTSDYVRTAKGLTDGLMATIGKDATNFRQAFGDGSNDIKKAMKNALTDFTTKGVLLSQGSSGGIPLPQLLERLLSQDKVNVEALGNRFSAMRENPNLKSALEEAEDEINASGANTAKRLQILLEALDKALPAEQINAMKRATSGLLESFRSFFLDPESGLFGLGRVLNFEVASFSADTGNRLEGTEAMGLFDLINDGFANIMVVLGEMLPGVASFFDPLSAIGNMFISFREESFSLFNRFNKFSKYFDRAETLLDLDPEKYQKGLRSAYFAMISWLESMGVIIEGANKIKDTLAGTGELTADFNKQTFTAIMQGFLSSDFMLEFGQSVGKGLALLIGKIRDAIKGISGAAVEGTGPLAEAIKAFGAAGGGQAFREIVSTLIGSLFRIIKEQLTLLAKENPKATLAAGITGVFAMFPGLLGGLIGQGSSLLGQVIPFVVTGLGGLIKGAFVGLLKFIGPLLLKIVSVVGFGIKNFFIAIGTFLSGPIGLGIIGVLITSFLSKFIGDPIKNFFTNVSERFSNWAAKQTGAWGKIVQALALGFKALAWVVKTIINILQGIADFFIYLFKQLGRLWKQIKKTLGSIGETIWGWVQKLFDALPGPIKRVLRWLGIAEKDIEKDSQDYRRKMRERHRGVLNASTEGLLGEGREGSVISGNFSSSTSWSASKSKHGATGATPGLAGIRKTMVDTSGTRNITSGDVSKLGGEGSVSHQLLSEVAHLAKAMGLGISSARRDNSVFHNWGPHGGALDIDTAGSNDPRGIALYHAIRDGLGGTGKLKELLYTPVGKGILGGQETTTQYIKPGTNKGHYDHLHVAFSNYKGYLAPLLEEARKKPFGSEITAANSSEAVMTPSQIQAMFAGITSGSGGGIQIGTINVNGGSSKEVAAQVLDEIELAIRESKLASVYL